MSGLSRDPILPSVLPSQLLSELARRGMDTAPLRARFELPPSTDEQPFVMVPLSRLRAFADEAALLSGDDFLGLHAGENGRSNILSVLAFACSGVRTGRDALEAFVKHVSAVHDELTFTLHERPGGVELRMKLAGHPDCLGRQGNEHWIASYLSAAALRFASPASKSLPTIESMLTNTANSLLTKGIGPSMDHTTRVPAPTPTILPFEAMPMARTSSSE